MYYWREDSRRAFASCFYALMRMHQYTEAEECARHGSGGLVGILMDAITNRQTGSISSFIEIQSAILLSKLRSRLYYLSDRNDGSIVGTVRYYQRHDHILRCFQYRTRLGCCYYERRGEALLRRYSSSVWLFYLLWSIAYFTQRLDHIISDIELCFSVLEFRCDSKKEMWTLAYNQGPIFVNYSFFFMV